MLQHSKFDCMCRCVHPVSRFIRSFRRSSGHQEGVLMSGVSVVGPRPRDNIRSGSAAAVALGVAIAFVDGYDLFLFGAVGPSLLAYAPWGATAATLGLIGSLTTLGMPLGAIA